MQSSHPARGQAVIAVTLSLMLLFGMLALAVDLGLAHFRRQAAQTAADAAALAAVRAALETSPYDLACGSSGVWCGAATACPSSPPGAAATSFDNGCMLAAANGFTTAERRAITLEANTTSPAPAVPGPAVAYWVTARASESAPPLFGVFLRGELHPSARATAAAVTGGGGGGCLYALDPHAQNALQVGNGAQVTLECGIFVNSDARSPSAAMYVSGGAYVSSTSIQVTGDFRKDNSGETSVTPVTGAPAVADPFGHLPPPVPDPSCIPGDFTNWRPDPYTPAPGTYCGFSIGNSMEVQMSPGVYIVNGGVFSIQGGSRLSGAGVIIYLTNGATVNIGNGTTVTLSASTEGTYRGVLFYQDRAMSAPEASHFAGGSRMNLTGSLYLPNALVNYDNGNRTEGAEMAIVAGRINIQSGARLVADLAGAKTGIGGGFKLALIE